MEPNKFMFWDESGFEIKDNTNIGNGEDVSCQNQDAGNQIVMCPPIHECPQERVCHRYICYEVPHIMPCNTKIINHHIYKHTYTPCYTCCEENVVTNDYGPKCCF